MRSLLLAVALAVALPRAAIAQPVSEPSGPATYTALHLGAFIPTGTFKDYDPGISLAGLIGARFNAYLSAELEVGWDNASQKVGGSTQSFLDVPIALNLVVRFPAKVAELTVYGGPAIHLSGITTLSGNHVADTVFGFQAGAGIAFNLSRTIAVGADAQWSFANANYGLGYGDVTIDGLRATATLQWRF
jgi:opacity protein-like surface antigen